MKNLILLEYFTSQSFVDLEKDKEIFQEALNLTNSIIKNFIKSDQINYINVIRNINLEIIKSKKVKTFSTNQKISYIDILKKLESKNQVLLIAPETKKLSLKFYSSIPKRFEILNSNYKSMSTFSSKKKMLKTLGKLNFPIVNNLKSNSRYKGNIVVKPDFGAGSEETLITKSNNYVKKKNQIIQKFYNGKKGSFLMLCKNGRSKVICCNEQIIKLNSKKIKQIGCIMGGLEKHRNEIESLANGLSKEFKGLFGVVGVDIVREKRRWLIIEINSRFTSAYCGLKESYGSSTIKEITNFYTSKNINDFTPKFLKKHEYFF